MKSSLTFLALTILLLGTAQAAELDLLKSKLRKYSPRGLCVCQDHGADHGEVGHISWQVVAPQAGAQRVDSSCWVSLYGSDGNHSGGAACDRYIPLAR